MNDRQLFIAESMRELFFRTNQSSEFKKVMNDKYFDDEWFEKSANFFAQMYDKASEKADVTEHLNLVSDPFD